MEGIKQNSIYIIIPLVCFALLACKDPESKKPNVVIILVDDLGWSDLGCYGNAFHNTPNIDNLAKNSKQFMQAYAAPVCSPSRAALLTGKSPAFLKLTEHLRKKPYKSIPTKWQPPEIVENLPLTHITLAEVLQQAGYTTAAFGKWHLGGKGYLPTNQGFDFSLAGSRDGMPGSYYYPFSNKSFQLPEMKKVGKEGDYLTDVLTKQAIDFLQQSEDKPFFLYLSFFAVHTPIKGKKELVEKYRSKGNASKYGADYAAMVETLDQNVGKVLNTLESLDYMDNTILVFASDNGGLATTWSGKSPVTDNSPLKSGKGSLYEGGIRIPLMVKFPNTSNEGVSNVPVILEDIFPTILDYADIPTDELESSQLHGVSLEPLWNGKTALERTLFWHFPHYGNMEGSEPASAVREGKWKLIKFYEGDRTELYNLEEDIGEQQNLVDVFPEKASQLTMALNQWKKEVGAAEPTPPKNTLE